jgi:hypothetical protein
MLIIKNFVPLQKFIKVMIRKPNMRKAIFYAIALIMLPMLTNGQETKTKKSIMILEIQEGDIKIGLAGSDTAKIYCDDGHTITMTLVDTLKYFIYSSKQDHSATIVGKNIISMDCKSNIKNLNVSKNLELTTLRCALKNLNVSKNTKLVKLDCANGHLTSLDVSKNTELMELYCGSGTFVYQLSNLDVSNNTKLTILDCQNNLITNLDLSKNIALIELNCFNNVLQGLDVSKNTKLIKLDCANNRLQGLDVSKNIALKELNCKHNQLTNLNVSKNTKLIKLDCAYNQLDGLDVSKNIALTTLYCNNNNLSEEALNALFTTLHNNKTEEKKIIYIYRNSGASTCNKTIAEEKGWEVVTTKN